MRKYILLLLVSLLPVSAFAEEIISLENIALIDGSFVAIKPNSEQAELLAQAASLQSNEDLADRKRELKSKNQSKPCMNCPACGGPGLCTYSSHPSNPWMGCTAGGHFSCETCP